MYFRTHVPNPDGAVCHGGTYPPWPLADWWADPSRPFKLFEAELQPSISEASEDHSLMGSGGERVKRAMWEELSPAQQKLLWHWLSHLIFITTTRRSMLIERMTCMGNIYRIFETPGVHSGV